MVVNIWPKVLLLGDSLTQHSFDSNGCWGWLLADSLQRKADVVVRGFSGYNTRWMKIILPKLVNKEFLKQTACVTICLGANDSWFETKTNHDAHVPLDEFRENIKEMVKILKKMV